MPIFVFENTRWRGMRYENREQTAPDVETAITQFLQPRVSQQQIEQKRMHSIADGNVPRDCTVVYQVEDNAERLVAAFTVPLGATG